MFSPQKPAEPAQPQRAPSPPPIEAHLNRVQKPRQKGRAASRKGASRAPRLPARILGSPELGEEEPSKVSRRHSEFPRASARLNDLSSDDEHNQTIAEGISVSVTRDDGADSITFASQPAHLRSLLNSTQEDETAASEDPDEEMADALDQPVDEEDEDVVIGMEESEPDDESNERVEKQSDIKIESKVKIVATQDDVSAIVSEATPVPTTESGSEITPAPVSEAGATELSDLAEVNTAEAEDEAKDEGEEEEDEGDLTINRGDGLHSFTEILDHRWVGDEVELKVGWYRGSPTWEPESILHSDAPESLFSYWRSQGGRPTNPRDADIFDIFAIRNHSRDKKKLLVEWTGYEPKENSWVPSNVVEETAPEVVAQYWKSIKKAPEPKTAKGRATKANAPKANAAKAKTTKAKTAKAKTSKAKAPATKTPQSRVTKTKAPARRKR
ncbi:unnamed protein product [Clonostachys rhizophaga]|uniref:Chromo domain-containing protein n=1 Tax=Clonostachys rhizophaga TaxID=160324 RepID=A0A9N9VCR9_9HYPO|nr:unnamed protein product [Clonostachys rhizophaga]